MDDYYINPEDREGILELGVGDNSMDIVTKPIKTDVKVSSNGGPGGHLRDR